MGYHKQNGEYADTEDVTLAASTARTATGQGSALELGDRGTVRLLLDCTAASGTNPTLVVAIQTSHDGSTWRELGAFTQLTASGSQRISLGGCDRFVRAAWGIGGTDPSFTFSVSGESA